MTGMTLTGPAAADGGASVLLGVDVRRPAVDVTTVVRPDRRGRGAVSASLAGGAVRRAEPGPVGPLLLEAQRLAGGTRLAVWGPSCTPAGEVQRALAAAGAWVGLADDSGGFADAVAGSPVLRRLLHAVGEVRLSRLPRVGEALGRSVLEQLVQSVEAARTTAQVVALTGTPAGGALSCWPTAAQIGRVSAWDLRRCGVSRRGAQALHAAAVEDARLERARHRHPDDPPLEEEAASPPSWNRRSWDRLAVRLCALPGVGIWTSAETRLRLGDPDAVSFGDYNLPALVGSVLTGAGDRRPASDWSDEDMAALLAPFAGFRGRVIRLVELGLRRGLLRRPPRRAPRAALSVHRYW